MFLITIKKAADQGATCKDSLDIDYTVLFCFMTNHFVGFTPHICVCACIFLGSNFCKSHYMYSSLELWETQSNVKRLKAS